MHYKQEITCYETALRVCKIGSRQLMLVWFGSCLPLLVNAIPLYCHSEIYLSCYKQEREDMSSKVQRMPLIALKKTAIDIQSTKLLLFPVK